MAESSEHRLNTVQALLAATVDASEAAEATAAEAAEDLSIPREKASSQAGAYIPSALTRALNQDPIPDGNYDRFGNLISSETGPQSAEDAELCTICREHLDSLPGGSGPSTEEDSRGPHILPCGHKFHQPCMKRWCDESCRGNWALVKCPECRMCLLDISRMEHQMMAGGAEIVDSASSHTESSPSENHHGMWGDFGGHNSSDETSTEVVAPSPLSSAARAQVEARTRATAAALGLQWPPPVRAPPVVGKAPVVKFAAPQAPKTTGAPTGKAGAPVRIAAIPPVKAPPMKAPPPKAFQRSNAFIDEPMAEEPDGSTDSDATTVQLGGAAAAEETESEDAPLVTRKRKAKGKARAKKPTAAKSKARAKKTAASAKSSPKSPPAKKNKMKQPEEGNDDETDDHSTAASSWQGASVVPPFPGISALSVPTTPELAPQLPPFQGPDAAVPPPPLPVPGHSLLRQYASGSCSSRPELPEETIWCKFCKSLCSKNRARMCGKKQQEWKCSGCNSTLVKLNGVFGSWPTPDFVELSEQEQANVFQETKGKKSAELQKMVEKKFNRFAREEKSWFEGGEFLPLSVWERRGFDPDRIERETKDCDKMFTPQLGQCYRVAVINTGRGGSSGTETSHVAGSVRAPGQSKDQAPKPIVKAAMQPPPLPQEPQNAAFFQTQIDRLKKEAAEETARRKIVSRGAREIIKKLSTPMTGLKNANSTGMPPALQQAVNAVVQKLQVAISAAEAAVNNPDQSFNVDKAKEDHTFV